jgi:hypothetical protein
VDSSKQIISAKNDGGSVLMLNHGESVVSFVVLYPAKTAEVYTFLKKIRRSRIYSCSYQSRRCGTFA